MNRSSLAWLVCFSVSISTLADEKRSTVERITLEWGSGEPPDVKAVKLSTFPLAIEQIDHIRPLGMMAGGHVTPSDHLYIVPVTAKKDQAFDVLAVADGKVTLIQWRPKGNPDPTAFDREVDYKLFIEHSRTVFSYVDHLADVSPDILKAAGREVKPGQPVRLTSPVKAGQKIGKVTRSFDFALIDTSTCRKGFINLEHFTQRDPWKPHTVDPYDYMDGALRDKALAKNPRKVAPLGGRIDYDIDGRLVGNWYCNQTGGYAGLNRRLDYWVGHLSIVYHYINSSQIIVSTGDFAGKARQFQVVGNKPDPASISKADGIVKYELMMPHISDTTGEPFADFNRQPQGVLLVQLLEDRKLRAQFFPGQSPEQVKDFTADAAVYER